MNFNTILLLYKIKYYSPYLRMIGDYKNLQKKLNGNQCCFGEQL